MGLLFLMVIHARAVIHHTNEQGSLPYTTVIYFSGYTSVKSSETDLGPNPIVHQSQLLMNCMLWVGSPDWEEMVKILSILILAPPMLAKPVSISDPSLIFTHTSRDR